VDHGRAGGECDLSDFDGSSLGSAPFTPALVADHAGVQAALRAVSGELRVVASVPVITAETGALSLHTGDAIPVAFAVSPAALAAAPSIWIDAPAGATVVVRVDCAEERAAKLPAGKLALALTGGVTASHVLYDFTGCTDVDLTGAVVQGTILAIDATVTFVRARVEGGLYARELHGHDAQVNAWERDLTAADDVDAYRLVGGQAVPTAFEGCD
jgi:choice-of-anchor A domain-containing protein